jgi:hypothetical protein
MTGFGCWVRSISLRDDKQKGMTAMGSEAELGGGVGEG